MIPLTNHHLWWGLNEVVIICPDSIQHEFLLGNGSSSIWITAPEMSILNGLPSCKENCPWQPRIKETLVDELWWFPPRATEMVPSDFNSRWGFLNPGLTLHVEGNPLNNSSHARLPGNCCRTSNFKLHGTQVSACLQCIFTFFHPKKTDGIHIFWRWNYVKL